MRSENQSISGVTTICLTQCNTSPSHRVDQVVDCGLWNVGPLLFNSCAKLLDIGRNWNTLLYTPIQSFPNMLNRWHDWWVCWLCKNWDVFSFQVLCTDPCNMGPCIISSPSCPKCCSEADYWNKKRDHISPILACWLPVKFRIDFKIAVFVFKAVSGLAPKYISDRVVMVWDFDGMIIVSENFTVSNFTVSWYTGIKQSKQVFFGWQSMFIQISFIKNNQVDLYHWLYISLTTYIHH